MTITIVGLGPGDPALLTRQADAALRSANVVFMRTGRHPAFDYLRAAGVPVKTFDAIYERGATLTEVYDGIVHRLIALDDAARGCADVVYAVPGHPRVGERTTQLLVDWSQREGRPLRLIEGVSPIEPALRLAGADAADGLQMVDAQELVGEPFPALDTDRPALILHVESGEVASDVKLALGALYPDEHQVILVQSPATPEERASKVPLFELDRQAGIDHATSLYVPALPYAASWLGLQRIVATLRAPGGCPWDREQTHRTLRQHLLDEAYEVLDALDRDDADELCGELGDLALQIALHCQIALEEGEFTPSEVFASIIAKLRRRHPHVFGDVKVDGAGQVLVNWEQIKREERGESNHRRQFEGVPASLPALAQALTYQERAARVGHEPELGQSAVERLRELTEAEGPGDEVQWGNLLFAIVAAARRRGVNPESALREANARFARSFAATQGETEAADDNVR